MKKSRRVKIDEHVFVIVHKLHSDGKTPKEIAQALNIGYSTTNAILRCNRYEDYEKYRDVLCEKWHAYVQKKEPEPDPVKALSDAPVQLRLDPYASPAPTHEQMERLITALGRIADALSDDKKIEINEEAN